MLDEFSISNQISNHWYNRASDLNAAAKVLFWAGSDSPPTFPQQIDLPTGFSLGIALGGVAAMNGGLALELIFKACLIRLHGGFKPSKWGHHKLVKLARAAGVEYSEAQWETLEALSGVVNWSGKYPIPFQQADLAAHKKNMWKLWKPSAQLTSARTPDPEKILSRDNYNKLWRIANARYWSIRPKDFREFGSDVLLSDRKTVDLDWGV